MQPERWQVVERLCQSAMALDPTRRAAFLDDSCHGDLSLKQEVLSLLVHADSDSFLAAPAVQVAARTLAGQVSIGRYRILRLLGEGGMGAVYEAEQDQPRRTVALKLIRPGFVTPETLRRFRDESQALGRLQHQGIAQIYEASTADTGSGPQPYFAMELIHGQPLHDYAEAHQLNFRDRLALIAKVCDAVDHAHHRGVIHRDLKPGNILVDETGQPKILDFGVARVTDSNAQQTRQTNLGQLIGTLAYMSPEQVAGDPAALDFRSDVYALGVILYELLAGKLPYDLGRQPLPEAAAIIRQEDPSPLSSIDRHFRGDIDTIAAKALEKDKARRYASAAELSADIRRYLADEPITARPTSATYNLQKFARRHKALVAGTAAVFLVLAAGVVASIWEAVRARKAEQAAASEAATAEAINNFLQNDLLGKASASNQAGPGTKPDPHLEVRTALDRAASRIEGKFPGRPEVEAAIRDTIGRTYYDLALYPPAQKQLERALELRRRVLGPENSKTLETIDYLGRIALEQGRFAQAEVLYRQLLQTRLRVFGPGHPDTVSTMLGLASAYLPQGKQTEAETVLGQALEISRRVLGPDHEHTVRSIFGLATLCVHQAKYARAEVLYREALESRRRRLGPEHPATLRATSGLAIAYQYQGKYAQAEAAGGQLLEIERRVLGSEHWTTVQDIDNLADTYAKEGKYAQAEQLYREAMDTTARRFSPNGPSYRLFVNGLATAYLSEHKHAEAEALLTHTLEVRRRALGPDNTETLGSISDLAFLYQRLGRYSLAEIYAAQALAGYRHTAGSEDSDTMAAAADLALAYQSQGKFAQSEPLEREAVQFYLKDLPDDWRRFRAESLQGAGLARRRNYTDAEPLLVEGYQGMIARKNLLDTLDRYYIDRAREWVIQLYQAWGKPDKAAEWKQR